MNYVLTLAIEGVSEKMFISTTLKGLPKEYESFTTLIKFSEKKKRFREIKRDLIKFDNDIARNKSESTFFYKERKCFNCQIIRHMIVH